MASADPDILAVIIEGVSNYTGVPASEIAFDSNMIDLGLQSIDAVILSGTVEDRFGIELMPSTVFEHPTVGGFALACTEMLPAR